MKKYVMQLVMLFVMCHAHAMENNSRYLYAIPNNVADRIAHFLDWETQEAFIKRTARSQQEKKLKYCKALSSDTTKLVMIKSYCDKGCYPSLTVYDVEDRLDPKMILDTYVPMHKFISVDFNKQGTHLLVRGAKYGKRRKRILFALHSVDQKSDLDKEREKRSRDNLLQKYFQHHMICKRF
jgi:hypothetical protein